MSALDFSWHLLSFAAPALTTACLCTLIAKRIWRREFARTRTSRLFLSAAAASTLGLTATAALIGADGTITAYVAMAFGCALAVWSHSRT